MPLIKIRPNSNAVWWSKSGLAITDAIRSTFEYLTDAHHPTNQQFSTINNDNEQKPKATTENNTQLLSSDLKVTVKTNTL